MQEQELSALQLFWLPPGPGRDERDKSLRAMVTLGLQGWDEDKMRLQWEEVGDVLGYSAQEAAEDWWVSWGVLWERSSQSTSSSTLASIFELVNGRGQKIAVACDVLPDQ